MAGQPYLSDYCRVGRLQKGVAGPVHIIDCRRTLTESQASRTFGFAVATFRWSLLATAATKPRSGIGTVVCKAGGSERMSLLCVRKKSRNCAADKILVAKGLTGFRPPCFWDDLVA